MRRLPPVILAVMGLSGCAGGPVLSPQAGVGPDPTLPAPHHALIPTLKIAPAEGWPTGETPVAAPGLAVAAFATGLNHPRWLYALPNGDVLVAESNAQPHKPRNLREWVQARVMKRAGAGVPSPDRIVLLRDTDGDGVAETRSDFLTGLTSPFGMALVGDRLYVADTDALLEFPYAAGQTAITAPGRRVTDLPALPINHHWSKNVVAGPDGSKLYVTVGSNSNVGESGLAVEEGRARILEVDRATGRTRPFATGLRNPNGMDWQPETGALWAAVNERDELGNDLVPDYMTAVRDGGFYGWPFSYWGPNVDSRVPARPDLVATAIRPDYGLGAHTASLGLVFNRSAALGAHFRSGAFIGQHGSWNRAVLNGYKVVFVPFAGGRPSGAAEDVLSGFVDAAGKARGRPVGVAFDRGGALLVADDVGNVVWRVRAERPAH